MSASSIRAGAAYIELTLRDSVSKPLHAASVALRDFGNSVAWQGAKIAAMGAAITAPLAAMAHSFATSALEAGKFANKRDADAVFQYVRALQQLGNAMAELGNAIGSAVMPLLARWPAMLSRIVTQATAWVRANRGLVQTIARVASAVAMAGAVIGVLGKVIAGVGGVMAVFAAIASGVATAVSLIGAIMAALASPVAAVIALTVVLGAVLLQTTGLGAQAIEWLAGAFGQLRDESAQAFQGIADALAAGDIAMAATVLWDFLKLEWKKGVDFINQIWINAKEFFVDVWTDASYAVAMLLTDPWYVMETAFNETVSFMQQGWLTFTGFLSKNLNWAVGEMEKLWVRFKAWLGSDIDVQANIKQIDETTKNADAVLAQGTADQKDKARARRDARRAEIEKNRTPEGRAVGDDWQRASDANQAAFEQQRTASRQRVADARRDFNTSTATARQKRIEFEKPKGPPIDLPVLLNQEQSKLESKGTFNAAAVRGLGSDSLAERTAKGVEKGADLLKNIKDKLGKAGAVFA